MDGRPGRWCGGRIGFRRCFTEVLAACEVLTMGLWRGGRARLWGDGNARHLGEACEDAFSSTTGCHMAEDRG